MFIFESITFYDHDSADKLNKKLLKKVKPVEKELAEELAKYDPNETGYITFINLRKVLGAINLQLDEKLIEYFIYLMKSFTAEDASINDLKYDIILTLLSQNEVQDSKIEERRHSLNSLESSQVIISKEEFMRRSEAILKRLAEYLYQEKLSTKKYYTDYIMIQDKDRKYNAIYLKLFVNLAKKDMELDLDSTDIYCIFQRLKNADNIYNIEVLDYDKLVEEMINYGIYEDELERASSVDKIPSVERMASVDNIISVKSKIERMASVDNITSVRSKIERIEPIDLMEDFAKGANGIDADYSQTKEKIIEKIRSYITQNNHTYEKFISLFHSHLVNKDNIVYILLSDFQTCLVLYDILSLNSVIDESEIRDIISNNIEKEGSYVNLTDLEGILNISKPSVEPIIPKLKEFVENNDYTKEKFSNSLNQYIYIKDDEKEITYDDLIQYLESKNIIQSEGVNNKQQLKKELNSNPNDQDAEEINFNNLCVIIGLEEVIGNDNKNINENEAEQKYYENKDVKINLIHDLSNYLKAHGLQCSTLIDNIKHIIFTKNNIRFVHYEEFITILNDKGIIFSAHIDVPSLSEILNSENHINIDTLKSIIDEKIQHYDDIMIESRKHSKVIVNDVIHDVLKCNYLM